MVTVRVRAEQMRDSLRVEARPFDVRDDRLRSHPCADVDESDLRTSVEDVDVTVVGIGEVEAECARSDEVDALVEPQPECASSYVGPPVPSTQ